MQKLCFRLMTLFALLCGAMAAHAATHIAPSLVPESATPAAGAKVTLAIAMKPEAEWHGYWQNPGDSGVETRAEWALPAGVTAGPLIYPVPHTLIVAGLMNYVYEGDYAHLVELTVPPGLAPGTRLPVRAKLDWLACTREVCVPESAEIATELTVGDNTADPARAADFARWRAAIPKPLGSAARFAVTGGKLRIAVPLPAAAAVSDPYFFPREDGVVDYAAAQSITRNGDTLVIELKPADGGVTPATLSGILRIGKDSGLAIEAGPGAVPAAGAPIAAAGEEAPDGGLATILAALGGAILGGLILNVMPCVFPILSLKALSLAKAGGDEGAARREALAYTLGAVLVCAGLGAAVLALRATGAAAGWAFQLQDARVILVLLLLTAAIAFNLAGLFELPAVTGGSNLAGKGGVGGAFWTGALAAFVATPCTGPFMGAALGVAIALPPVAALAVFAGLGLGLALPFLLIGFVPAVRRRLPKPGPWMDRLRRILSIPMFATALGLAWVLGRIAGVDGMTFGLVAALVVALALWWVGRRQDAGRSAAWWPMIPAAVAAAALVMVLPRAPAEAAKGAEGLHAAEPFSEARLAALQAEGRPVFVYFTADWCLTCKVNEKAAIERQEVADAFRAKRIAVLVGDWTRGDAAIGRFLGEHGRSGVPLYLFYRAGVTNPEVLPQVLTPQRLTALPG